MKNLFEYMIKVQYQEIVACSVIIFIVVAVLAIISEIVNTVTGFGFVYSLNITLSVIISLLLLGWILAAFIRMHKK